MKAREIAIALLVVALFSLEMGAIAFTKSISKPQPNLLYGKRYYLLWLSDTFCNSVYDKASGVENVYAYASWLAPGTDWWFKITSKKPDPYGIGYDIKYQIDYCNFLHDIDISEPVGEVVVVLVYD